MSATLDAARDYARRGHRVVPVIGKRPPFGEWQKLATSDSEQVERWWRTWPDANVGLLCGPRYAVLDVDPRLGGDEILAELTARHGPLPDTVKVATGGGGWHHYFAAQGLASYDLARGLELRSVGRQVVAPPSIHPDTGREYVWLARSPLAPLPAWLVKADPGGRPAAAPPDTWAQMLREGIPEGQRNASLARLTGHWLRRYLPAYEVDELVHLVNAERCRPPLPRAEVDRIIQSVAGRELRRLQSKGTR